MFKSFKLSFDEFTSFLRILNKKSFVYVDSYKLNKLFFKYVKLNASFCSSTILNNKKTSELQNQESRFWLFAKFPRDYFFSKTKYIQLET